MSVTASQQAEPWGGLAERQNYNGIETPRAEHGTRARYKTGCHCTECTTAERTYRNRYRAARRPKQPPTRTATCHGCGASFPARSKDAKWCSDLCRGRARPARGPTYVRSDVEPGVWREHAQCVGCHQIMWDPAHEAQAKALCAQCPVRDDCHAEVLERRDAIWGVWAGMNPEERAVVIRQHLREERTC